MKLKEVSFAEALDVLLLRGGLTWEVLNGELVVAEIKLEGNAEVHLKLDRVKLENVEFTNNATFRQAINFMRLRARELDDGVPVNERGLGFVFRGKSVKETDNLELDDEAEEGFGGQDKIEKRLMAELAMQHVSLREALTVICRRANVQWHVGEFRVIFSNRED